MRSCCYCEVVSVVSDSVQPLWRQPTRLPRPWDSPGKNTGVGCHFLLQRMKVKSESEVAQLCPTFVTPWTTTGQASLSIANSRSLLKLMSIESMMPFNHLIHCHLLLLLPSTFPNIRVFSDELVLYIRWPKYWSFNFNISPSNEYSGLIAFRMGRLDLFKVQGTLKSLLQHHSSILSILRHSAFFIVQLSYPSVTTGKTIESESESEVAQSVQLFATPWTVAHQVPPSMGFSRQEYWSGLPFPLLWLNRPLLAK